MKIGTRIYGTTYGLTCFLGPSGSNAVCMPPDHKVKYFFKIL